VAEAYALNHILGVVLRQGYGKGWIHDWGGSGHRHDSYTGRYSRRYVWNSNPKVNAKDGLRTFLKKQVNTCQCFAQSCLCKTFLASISVHTLYYLSPDEIIEGLKKQKFPTHVAVLHPVWERRDSYMHGELAASYSGGRVVMTARGNINPYVHSDMAWMKKSHHRGLTWEILRKFDDVYVVQFFYDSNHRYVDEVSVTEKNDMFSNICSEEYRVESLNPRNQRAYVARVRRRAKENNLNPEEAQVAALAYYFKASSLRHEVPVPKNFAINKIEREELLEQVPTELFNMTRFLLIWVVLHSVGLKVLPRLLGNGAKMHLVTAGVSLAVAGIYEVYRLWNTLKRHVLKILPLSLFGLKDYCVNDHSVELAEIDPEKTTRQPLMITENVCDPVIRAFPMVYSPFRLPFMPRRCWHNITSSIRNRVLCSIDRSGFAEWDRVKIPDELVKALSNIEIEPLSLDEWLERFPNKKALRLREEWEAIQEDVDAPVSNKTGFFIKTEFYPKPKAPRPIHSSPVLLNFLTGRWLVPLGEALSKELTDTRFMFPVHGDSKAIGEWFEAQEGLVAMNDFSKFDATQSDKALEHIIAMLRLTNIPSSVLDLMAKDIKGSIVKSKSAVYGVKGVRLSGRSETLIGNTLLNLSIMNHALKSNLLSMIVKGDDSVIFLDRADSMILKSAENTLNRLGFSCKLGLTDMESLEFCSSYLMPTNEGLVLTPKPGKLLAKTFWCKNTNYTQEQIREQFAGILNGLRTNLAHVPILRGLYANPAYIEHRFAKPIRQEYNEYSPGEFAAIDDTYIWVMNHYGLSFEDVEDMERFLSTADFPIDLSLDSRFECMIDKDWGSSSSNDFDIIVKSPLLEELAKRFFGWPMALAIGLIETWRGNWFALPAHASLWFLGSRKPLFLAVSIGLHALWNAYACQTGRHNLSMTRSRKNKATKPKQQPPRTSKRGNPAQSAMQGYAHMLSDPCDSQLIPGLYSTSEGMLNKLKSTESFPSASLTSGYVLWDPSFTSRHDTAAPVNFNAVFWQNSSSATNPLNTTASPFGLSSNNSGAQLRVGAGPFCQSTTVSDARCVGACLRLLYTGRMDASSGIVGYISNLPAGAVLGSNGVTPASVDELLAMSDKVDRLGTGPIEIRFTPAQYSSVFRSNSEGVFDFAPGKVTTLTNESEVAGSKLMGFAFKNVPDVADLLFEFYQNIEWRPNLDAGFVMSVPRSVSQPGNFERVLRYLDKNAPNWRVAAKHLAIRAANRLARIAMTGVGSNPSLTRQAILP
jgi:hypothetical protein